MKNNFSNTPIGRLRAVGILEGLSFLLLLGIAMPLKYMAGIPEAVKYTGWAHGLLFVLYIGAVMQAAMEHNWSFKKIVISLLASLFPFGPFLIDGKLKEEEQALNREAVKKVA
ncbi:DUF3817 domain-containing protein [Pontibacter qinzhouensis]|uniref:DUF3817 domain-containing protein n=1 Tax=Pontibacter qinzhouensis TaxID=2603253 RepID=A0A5C8KBR2_9BACT|nr:DUF3817 domain-containing protein [Pontibacter qinzhouensis]TXK48612.1 DUF3817 domain-containing protein [Pontibacter qinzhouensis]